MKTVFARLPATGTLFVVATPIGNLEDWSRRGEQVLRTADLILCEDTRHTRKLLERFGIHGSLESYHDFNETGKARRLAERIRSGASVALVSDAGTPTLSDPGYRIVRECRESGLPVIPIPGPSAAVAALSVSGLPTDTYLFIGFLPSKKDARRRRLESLRSETATLVLYEAPHRLRATLGDIHEILGDRRVFLGREMTKLHEEYTLGSASQLLGQAVARGEAVLVVDGAGEAPQLEAESIDLSGMSRQEIVKLAARRLGVRRRELYDALFRKTKD